MNQHSPDQIDPRGPRFNASLTAVVLAVVLVTAPGAVGVALLAVQALLFGIGATRGVTHTPAAYLFKSLVRPRLAAPSHLEDATPPRFAQTVGLGFALAGLVGYGAGATVVGAVAVGMALVAALLNAVFGFCLGCELYLLGRRLAPASAAHRTAPVTRSANGTSHPSIHPTIPEKDSAPAQPVA